MNPVNCSTFITNPWVSCIYELGFNIVPDFETDLFSRHVSVLGFIFQTIIWLISPFRIVTNWPYCHAIAKCEEIIALFCSKKSPTHPSVWAMSRADVFHVYISIQLFNLSSLHLIQLAAQQGAKDLLLPQNTEHREIDGSTIRNHLHGYFTYRSFRIKSF